MGHILSSVREIFEREPKKVVMIGLDAAGKTTIMYSLRLAMTSRVYPLIATGIEECSHRNMSVIAFDVGGQERLRPLWRRYFLMTRGLIWVVDSVDRERIEQSREELRRILDEESLRGVVLLVLANKQDLPTAMPLWEVAMHLGLHEVSSRMWLALGTCATSGAGLEQGFDWLEKAVKSRRRLIHRLRGR